MSSLMKFILMVLAAVAVRQVINVVWYLDFFRHVHYHEPGPCKLVPGVETGSEDMEATKNGIAYMSNGLELGFGATKKKFKGKILAFDLKNPQGGVKEVTLKGDFDLQAFNPVGVSIWEDQKSGQSTLFVANHPFGYSYVSVEIFRVEEETVFQHVQTIKDPLFRLVNDIVATSATTFYATNSCYYFQSRPLLTLEFLLSLPYANVVYYDGKKVKEVLSGQNFLNGISMSPDKKTIYVAHTLKEEIGVYDIKSDDSLALRQSISTHMNPDNINVDETTGDIWVAGQALLYKNIPHEEDSNYPASSQVIRIRFKDGSTEPFIESVYSEIGVRLFGASVAERYKDVLLVGTIKSKLMYCQIKHLAE